MSLNDIENLYDFAFDIKVLGQFVKHLPKDDTNEIPFIPFKCPEFSVEKLNEDDLFEASLRMRSYLNQHIQNEVEKEIKPIIDPIKKKIEDQIREKHRAFLDLWIKRFMPNSSEES
jgi:hypothetical protein